MLVIEDNSVYEIDEVCVKQKQIPKECGIYEKLMQEKKKNEKGLQKQDKKSDMS